MAAQHELYNFLSKFLHLLNIGKNAQLILECQNGEARVHLHHVIGHHPPQPHCREHHHHPGPSRLRRRARRAEARAAAAATVSTGPAAYDEINNDCKEALNINCAVEAPAKTEVAEKACQVSPPQLITHHQDQAVQVGPPPPKLCHEVAVQTPPNEVHTVPGGHVQANLVLPHQQNAARSEFRGKKLSIQKVQRTSIPPRGIYHPAIINACIAITGKHPSQLTTEEANKFNTYQEYKIQQGDPIEKSIIYMPSDMKNCLQCGELT